MRKKFGFDQVIESVEAEVKDEEIEVQSDHEEGSAKEITLFLKFLYIVIFFLTLYVVRTTALNSVRPRFGGC